MFKNRSPYIGLAVFFYVLASVESYGINLELVNTFYKGLEQRKILLRKELKSILDEQIKGNNKNNEAKIKNYLKYIKSNIHNLKISSKDKAWIKNELTAILEGHKTFTEKEPKLLKKEATLIKPPKIVKKNLAHIPSTQNFLSWVKNIKYKLGKYTYLYAILALMGFMFVVAFIKEKRELQIIGEMNNSKKQNKLFEEVSEEKLKKEFEQSNILAREFEEQHFQIKENDVKDVEESYNITECVSPEEQVNTYPLAIVAEESQSIVDKISWDNLPLAALGHTELMIFCFDQHENMAWCNSLAKDHFPQIGSINFNDFVKQYPFDSLEDHCFEYSLDGQKWYGLTLMGEHGGEKVKVLMFHKVKESRDSQSKLTTSFENKYSDLGKIISNVCKSKSHFFSSLKVDIEVEPFELDFMQVDIDAEFLIAKLLDCAYYLIKNKRDVSRVVIYPIKKGNQRAVGLQIQQTQILSEDLKSWVVDFERQHTTVSNILNNLEQSLKKLKGRIVIYNSKSKFDMPVAHIEAWYDKGTYSDYRFNALDEKESSLQS